MSKLDERASETVAKAICRVQINGGDPDQPAMRWNGTEMEPQEFPAWHDYRDEAVAALSALSSSPAAEPVGYASNYGLARLAERHQYSLGVTAKPEGPFINPLFAAPVELDALRRERDVWKDNAVQARSVIAMIRAMVGEMFGPVASIESEDATLLRGPEAKHDGEAVLKALQRVSSTFTRVTAERDEAVRLLHAELPCPYPLHGKAESNLAAECIANGDCGCENKEILSRLSRKDTDNG